MTHRLERRRKQLELASRQFETRGRLFDALSAFGQARARWARVAMGLFSLALYFLSARWWSRSLLQALWPLLVAGAGFALYAMAHGWAERGD